MNKELKIHIAAFLAAVLVGFVLMIGLLLDAPSAAETELLLYAREQGINVEDYPPSLIRLMAVNPETKEFVLNYPNRKELETDLSGYDLSRGVPLLMQWDPRWGYMEYGSDMVAVTGCGPVCLAMAGYYVTGDPRFYPDRVVEFALEHDYYSPGNGSKWTLISQGGEELGLRVTELPLVERKIADYLRSGAPVIAVMGPGDFTSTGHFIVLTAYQDGMLTVNDPNSYVNSGKQWDYDAVKDQIRNLWVIQPGTDG